MQKAAALATAWRRAVHSSGEQTATATWMDVSADEFENCCSHTGETIVAACAVMTRE